MEFGVGLVIIQKYVSRMEKILSVNWIKLDFCCGAIHPYERNPISPTLFRKTTYLDNVDLLYQINGYRIQGISGRVRQFPLLDWTEWSGFATRAQI